MLLDCMLAHRRVVIPSKVLASSMVLATLWRFMSFLFNIHDVLSCLQHISWLCVRILSQRLHISYVGTFQRNLLAFEFDRTIRLCISKSEHAEQERF